MKQRIWWDLEIWRTIYKLLKNHIISHINTYAILCYLWTFCFHDHAFLHAQVPWKTGSHGWKFWRPEHGAKTRGCFHASCTPATQKSTFNRQKKENQWLHQRSVKMRAFGAFALHCYLPPEVVFTILQAPRTYVGLDCPLVSRTLHWGWCPQLNQIEFETSLFLWFDQKKERWRWMQVVSHLQSNSFSCLSSGFAKTCIYRLLDKRYLQRMELRIIGRLSPKRVVKHAESVERSSRPMHGRSRNKRDGSYSCQWRSVSATQAKGLRA